MIDNKLPDLSFDNPSSTLHAEVNAACFVRHFNALAYQVHEVAVAHGWWKHHPSDGEVLCGLHSEVSEAYEALRIGNPQCKYIPKFTAEESELADLMLRTMSYAMYKGLDIAGAIVAKAAYNEGRAYKHGNKKF